MWRTLLLLGAFSWSAVGATYYVSPSGSDTNSGLATNAAWQTVNKVNSVTYSPGDRVLFLGGATFSGSKIYVAGPSGGSAANAVVFSSYGTGRATIAPGNTDGFYAYNAAGLVISNLNFIGTGRTTNTGTGILFYSDGAAGAWLDYLRVADVDVAGFGGTGIVLGSWNGTNGYRDVRIERAAAYDNAKAGISSYAQYKNTHTNIYVADCVVHHNPGITNSSSNTGNGIVLGDVNNAIIERCVAYTNGWIGNASVGIWCYDSTGVTIQFCESFDNRTSGGQDGGGFDIDGGCTFCVVQYCYSHNNDGAGLGIYEYAGAPPFSNNVVRYNLSVNDGRKNSYGGITLWNGGAGLNATEVYNNTVYVGASASGSPRGIWFITATTDVKIRNNIVVTTNGMRLLDVPSGQTRLVFQGNAYWSSGAAASFAWYGATYGSLAAWRTASGQETFPGGVPAGYAVDPLLTAPGAMPRFTNTALLPTLSAYRLRPDSPLIDGAASVAPLLFPFPAATRDYFGGTLPLGAALDVGAHESWPTVTVTTPDALASEYNTNDTATFAVTRSGATLSNLVVSYAMSGTASSGTDYVALAGTVTIPAGSNSASVVLTPIADSLAESNETAVLTLALAATYTNGILTSATATILDKPYDAWRFIVFGTNANNPLVAGDAADSDGDGLNTLAEYLLGSDPRQANRANAPFSSVLNNSLALTWNRSLTATDLVEIVEGAPSVLGPWSTNAISRSLLSTSGGFVLTRAADLGYGTSTNASRFLRLRVSR